MKKRKILHTMPPIGTILVHKTRVKGVKSKTFYAKVIQTNSETGVGILYDNKIYNSMSAAANAAGGYTVDGWIYWKQSS